MDDICFLDTSPDGYLLRISMVATLNLAEFAVSEQLMIPGSYVEFAERKILSDGHRCKGFEAANADKIFESTYQERVSQHY